MVYRDRQDQACALVYGSRKTPSFRAERSEDPESRVLEIPYILDSRLRGNDGIPSLSSLSQYHSHLTPALFPPGSHAFPSLSSFHNPEFIVRMAHATGKCSVRRAHNMGRHLPVNAITL